jgi:hypothetical protein
MSAAVDEAVNNYIHKAQVILLTHVKKFTKHIAAFDKTLPHLAIIATTNVTRPFPYYPLLKNSKQLNQGKIMTSHIVSNLT